MASVGSKGEPPPAALGPILKAMPLASVIWAYTAPLTSSCVVLVMAVAGGGGVAVVTGPGLRTSPPYSASCQVGRPRSGEGNQSPGLSCIGATELGSPAWCVLGDGRDAPWPHWGDLKKQIRTRGRWSARSKAAGVSLAASFLRRGAGGALQSLGSLFH